MDYDHAIRSGKTRRLRADENIRSQQMDADKYYCPKCKRTWVDPAIYCRDPGCKYCDGPRVLVGMRDIADKSFRNGRIDPISMATSMLDSFLGGGMR